MNTISAVVYQCCADIGDLNNSRYEQFLGWALWSYRELNLDVTGNVERVCLEMDGARKIRIPGGYVDWSIIAFNGPDRVYSVLNRNGAMIWGICPTVSRLAPSQLVEIDEKAGTMSFSSLVSRQGVYLEFITDGLCGHGTTVVNPYLADYLRKCVHFERVDFDPGSSQGEIARRGRDKSYAETVVRARVMGITEDEMASMV